MILICNSKSLTILELCQKKFVHKLKKSPLEKKEKEIKKTMKSFYRQRNNLQKPGFI